MRGNTVFRAVFGVVVLVLIFSILQSTQNRIRSISFNIANSIVNGREKAQTVALSEEFGESTYSQIAINKNGTDFSIATATSSTMYNNRSKTDTQIETNLSRMTMAHQIIDSNQGQFPRLIVKKV